MKSLICLLLLIGFNYTYAQGKEKEIADFMEEVNEMINDIEVKDPVEDPCHECNVEDNYVEINDPLPTTYVTGKKFFNERCEKFITKTGQEGEWGKKITKYIDETPGAKEIYLYDEIVGMTAKPYTCPNWYKLNDDQRKRFWIWMFASIAQVESSCDTDVVNLGPVPDPTDRPTGLFQLNQNYTGRYWRGENCKFNTGYIETIDVDNQINCSMDIMMEVIKGKKGMYKGNGRIFPTNSYWEKLRPGHSSTGGPIGELVRQYPPCNATP